MNKNRIVLLLALIVCGAFKMVSQVSIDNPNPHPNSILDLDNPDSDKEALMLPKAKIELMRDEVSSTLSNLDTLSSGLVFFDRSTRKIQYFDGIAWQPLNPIKNRYDVFSSPTGQIGVFENRFDLEGNLNISQTLEADNIDVSENTQTKNLEVTENLKFTENGTASGKEGYVAVNENGGEVTWKDPATLPLIADHESRITSSENQVSTTQTNVTVIQSKQDEILDKISGLHSYQSGFVPQFELSSKKMPMSFLVPSDKVRPYNRKVRLTLQGTMSYSGEGTSSTIWHGVSLYKGNVVTTSQFITGISGAVKGDNDATVERRQADISRYNTPFFINIITDLPANQNLLQFSAYYGNNQGPDGNFDTNTQKLDNLSWNFEILLD